MDFIFADDAQQKQPSRPGMGPLVAVAGICVPGEAVGKLEGEIEALCADYGFPAGEEFKWSPGRSLWMHSNLGAEERQRFFIQVLTLAQDSGVSAIVVIEDSNCPMATDATSPEMDVTRLFLDRVQKLLGKTNTDEIVITPRPGGDGAAEDKFLAGCVEALQSGTDYVKPDHIVVNVLFSPSKFIRLLQVADVVTSCSTAAVSGEDQFSPPVFSSVKGLLAKKGDRIGGVGLKLHPYFMYANLYHWLVGDTHLWMSGTAFPLPLACYPYSSHPNTFSSWF
jgi:hypothetical protein